MSERVEVPSSRTALAIRIVWTLAIPCGERNAFPSTRRRELPPTVVGAKPIRSPTAASLLINVLFVTDTSDRPLATRPSVPV